MGLLKNSLQLQGRLRHVAAALTARRGAATSTEEYKRRNYADNVSEYNTVIGSLIAQRSVGSWSVLACAMAIFVLYKYAYIFDQPPHFPYCFLDTVLPYATGLPYLLRDAYDDMILDGVQPVRDTFHSLIIGTMKGNRLQDALYFRDQMKEMGLEPDVNLYNFLISTCGKSKNSDAAIMLVEEMKTHGVKLKGETYICLLNALAATGRIDQVYDIVNAMSAAGLGLDKFCYAGLITAFKNKAPATKETMMKVYHVCYLRCGDIDSAIKMFEEYSRSPPAELFVTLAEGAMIGYTPRGMQVAQETLEKMISRNYFLNPRMGTDLLLAAAGERTGGYTMANYIWDLLQSRNITPGLPAVEAYHKGLKEREIPSDDPRLVNVSRVLDNLSFRSGPRRNTQ
ncbi:hypothetical protein PR202_ga11243 [Eleusine coracana subsp. coracana]|uniref:PROP1-like PPR domain-containing protein n=1 Tax=Eleusine coracana subsp. coracana TaxID=191504 RepID=A0AAV5C8X8_ELECO|nr:hypothetical protein PR202_ga11243 [Eleusine coracana subsp. coracana]